MDLNVIGIADMKISNQGTLLTYGLGSCVGIAIYDERTKWSGLIHIMLPDSNFFAVLDNPLKFADTGIPLMVDELVKKGAQKSFMKAKIAGGSAMYANDKVKSAFFDIGKMNIQASLAALEKLDIEIIGQDTGGYCSRTLEFDIPMSSLKIKKMSKERLDILHL
ncbi:MAG: chemotaxis protein CheD [Clostridiales bacterium]|nr:chemotaxis protein CheD [Clostridiales bacterium]